MNWISTNIRFPEDQYMKLKIKAAKQRKSVAALVRDAASRTIVEQSSPVIETEEERKKRVEKFMKEIDRIAKANSKYVPKGFDSVKALREIRYGKE